MDYKKTLLLPITDFPMKANLKINELDIQQKWSEINLYHQIINKNKNNEVFTLHDGPPYANGNIHIGHALNKILKDFILRFKTMQGFKTSYIPGWDTHGLPIEIAISKNKDLIKNVARRDFRKKCKDFASFYIQEQKKQFQRLGILGDWNQAYLTFDNNFIAEQIKIFAIMVKKNLIFKDLKPVYYSPSLHSVLSEAEIEYFNIETNSIFVAFKVSQKQKNIFKKINLDSEFFLLIWTTTPWTLVANVAIAVHPKSVYQLIIVNNQRYLVGKENLVFLKKIFSWDTITIIDDYRGNELENLIYFNPLINSKGKVILANYVSATEGTGLVHIATAHGIDDYLSGKKYKLPIISAVDKKGLMTAVAEKYKGIYYEKANYLIIEDLKKTNFLLKEYKISHTYPHDNRVKKTVIFLAIPQWFLSIKKIRTTLLNEIQNVDWIPQWGKIKMHNMIKERQDWAISRQRLLGVPIPIFYDKNKAPILDSKLILHVASLFKKHGPDIWYEWNNKDLLPLDYALSQKINVNSLIKETDIMDVWFDSGVSHHILKSKNQNFPADIYLEGADQYRGWFNSSLIISTAVFNKAPYKKVITHGFVLDGEGQKMSKSLGNVIDPLKIISQKGADILRLWVATTDYNIDVRINDNILKQTEEIYRKIRNTLRFMLGNLNNFDPCKHYLDFQQRQPIHKVIMLKFNQILKLSLEAYENFQFEKVIRSNHVFLNKEISAFYLDFAKDILYIEKEDNLERRMIQSNIYDILMNLIKILHPIIPHTTSEIYQKLPFVTDQEDIYLESMPCIKQLKDRDIELIQTVYPILSSLKEKVAKEIELSRKQKVINSSLQAKVILNLNDRYLETLKILQIEKKLNQFFIVSQVEIKPSTNLKIQIKKASGTICPRCWHIVNDKIEDLLCTRCKNILNL